MKNKIVGLFVCMLLIGTFFVVVTDTVRAPWTGGYFYTVSGGVATITGYNGSGGVITIPSTLGGYPTTAIGNQAFRFNENLTSVTIPNSVITIGYSAFEKVYNLASVIIGNNVITIGDTAFYYCTSLATVTIGTSVTTIGTAAFAGCSSLTSVAIPSSVTTIGVSAFQTCSSLTAINVNAANVNYASVNGVLYNKIITTLIKYPEGKVGAFTIPSSVTTIGDYAFSDCYHLTSVTIPNSVKTIGNYTFLQCHYLTSMTIPNSVKTIGDYAFMHCDFPSVTIGNGVTTIGSNTFDYCVYLTSITFLGLVAPTTVGSNWILDTPAGLRGHAYAASNFPIPGELWHGLKMGTVITSSPVFGTPTPANGSTNNHFRYITWSIPISDPQGDLFDWYIKCNNQVNSGTNAANGTKSITFNWFLGFLTTYTVYVNATDPGGSHQWTYAWYNFTTMDIPPLIFGTPSPANGSANNPLSFTWSIPINTIYDAFHWTIQCSNGQNSSGEWAYNGTKSLTLSSLSSGTPFKVWVNASYGNHSERIYRRWYTFTTQGGGNNPPVFGTPSPGNGSTGNLQSLSWSIPINDSEGNVFSWTIQCSNGQTNSRSGASNGTKLLALSGLAYSTTYKIWVNATDPVPAGSGLYTRRWYTFTTQGGGNTPPVFFEPSPANGSTGNLQSLTWSIPINDTEGDLFSWNIECSNGQKNSGTDTTNGTKSLVLSGLADTTIYTILVNATDPTGSGLYTREWYTFGVGEVGDWIEIKKLLASDGATPDKFGWSVALSGDTALIGAYNDDDSRGSAYVFVRTGTTWTQQAKLRASDGATGDDFGWSVALSGDTALIGAINDDENGDWSGSAYVFIRTGTNWAEQKKLHASDGGAHPHYDSFGWSVALSGDTALIGVPNYHNDGETSGSAYVFTRTGTNWAEQKKLLASDGAFYFGDSVALDGNTALIGAYGDDSYKGSAYVFTRTGTTWTEQKKLHASDGIAFDQFGSSVALSGDTALIGAQYDSNNDYHCGSAYVFTRTGTTWTEQKKLLLSEGKQFDEFGSSVALSGDTALIGAGCDDDNGDNSGSAYVFNRTGTTWTQQAKLLASDGAYEDFFGSSVALFGDTALIGAFGDDNLKGSAYIFIKKGDLEIDGFCPIDLNIMDAEGHYINKTSSNIPGATYTEEDLDGDGDLDDKIFIPKALDGLYTIEVIPEPDADPTDTFSLRAAFSGASYYVATDVMIQDIPADDYGLSWPDKPATPDGKTNGKTGKTFTYTSSTTDPNDDQVYYLFDWGDGNDSGWLGPYNSGVACEAEHAWTIKGSYSIKVKAKDIHDFESDWSEPLPVTMPFSYHMTLLQLLQRFFERFPHAFPILRQMLG